MFWIGYFKMIGSDLLNHDNGGRVNYLRFTSSENKRKQSIACAKSNGTIEQRELFRQITTNEWKKPEVRKRRIESLKIPKSKQGCKNIKEGQTKAFGVKIKDQNNNIFNSMTEVMKHYNINKTTVQRLLYGKSRKYSHIKLERIGGGRKDPKDIKFDQYYVHKDRKPIENQIKDQYGTIYLNITEASKITKVSLRVVHRILKGEITNPRAGYKFEYVSK
jgi:hypothetical protein